jgi:hypothetical protein
VNLYDRYHALVGDTMEAIWPIRHAKAIVAAKLVLFALDYPIYSCKLDFD